MTLGEIAEVVDGRTHGDAGTVVSGSAFVDTRTPEDRGLFVAIAGEHVDGHDFAVRAVAGGAAAVLGSRPTEAPTVVVDDVVRALGVLARHVVDRLEATVLALTGSQGKTGVKDYLAAVLAADGPTVATAGNFNNEIGVPLTVLRATPETRHLVVEMGARGVGHIRYLCEVAPPRIAAVLNVGTAHIGEFGSRERIAVAKGEIVEALPPDGTAVLNARDELVRAMADRTKARVLTFGVVRGDVAARDVTADELGRCSFDLVHGGAGATVHLGQIGAHQVDNALAAAAMSLAAGLDLDTIADALTDARPSSRWRMELHERPDGVAVINDAYNANPESMEAALDALHAIGRTGRRTVAVLGEMLELGEGAVSSHRRVGHFAAAAQVDVLVTVGDAAAAIAEAASTHRTWRGRTVVTAGREEALDWLRHNVAGSDVVLVKASRGAALEQVADGLLAVGSDTGSDAGSDTGGDTGRKTTERGSGTP